MRDEIFDKNDDNVSHYSVRFNLKKKKKRRRKKLNFILEI